MRQETRRRLHGVLAALALSLPGGGALAGYYPMFAAWDQPGGAGSPITLTYSYSNLLDGSIRDGSGTPFDTSLLKNIFETAFRDYAAVLPISFVEVADRGPLPETGEYDPTGLADIRIGQVPHVDDANAYAYFPYSAQSGLAGDIVFNANRSGYNWPSVVFFYSVAQHELGHSLGMGHFVNEDPPATASFAGAAYQGPLIPLVPSMVSALQAVYGAGTGTVTPLAAVPEPQTWIMLLAGLVLVRKACRHRAATGERAHAGS